MDITASALQPILLDKCHRLRTLKISKCHWLTDGSLQCFLLHLNRNSFEAAKEHSLRSLDLSFTTQISSRVLNLFVRSQCLHLTTLNLGHLSAAVQDETLQAIANHNMGATIQNLNLVNCKCVTGTGINALKSCPQLRALLCRGMNLDRVKAAVVTFPSIVFIDIRQSCVVAMANN